MATDMLAPYQDLAQHAWEELQPSLLAQDQALSPMLAHHFKATGKLLRPALTLAFFDQLAQGHTSQTPHCPPQVVQTALAIEILHNATLVHDDLQDGDAFRRGVGTDGCGGVRAQLTCNGIAVGIGRQNLQAESPHFAIERPDAVFRLRRRRSP